MISDKAVNDTFKEPALKDNGIVKSAEKQTHDNLSVKAETKKHGFFYKLFRFVK